MNKKLYNNLLIVTAALKPYYDLSKLSHVVLSLSIDSSAKFRSVKGINEILVHPSVLELNVITSRYTGKVSRYPLLFVMLHEMYHYLVFTGQIPPSKTVEEEERQADIFADNTVAVIAPVNSDEDIIANMKSMER